MWDEHSEIKKKIQQTPPLRSGPVSEQLAIQTHTLANMAETQISFLFSSPHSPTQTSTSTSGPRHIHPRLTNLTAEQTTSEFMLQ